MPAFNDPDFSDQIGLFDPSTFDETVTLIGCGGIGASLLPTLVTMGVKKFILFDPDIVEPRNVASQLIYMREDVYQKPKVEICRDVIEGYYPDAEVEVHQRFFTADDSIDSAVVIGAVDSMAARQEIWQAVANSDASLYLDGRIGGEHFSLFAVDPLDGDWYKDKCLFDDSAVAPLPCAERAIIYTATVLGGIICRHLKEWHQGVQLPDAIHMSLKDLSMEKVAYKR